jgi:uncharacterized membrane protein YwaF
MASFLILFAVILLVLRVATFVFGFASGPPDADDSDIFDISDHATACPHIALLNEARLVLDDDDL